MMPFKLPHNISVKDHHSDLNQVGRAVILSKFKDFDSDALILDDFVVVNSMTFTWVINFITWWAFAILSANFIWTAFIFGLGFGQGCKAVFVKFAPKIL